jgi:hypothetical protein
MIFLRFIWIALGPIFLLLMSGCGSGTGSGSSSIGNSGDGSASDTGTAQTSPRVQVISGVAATGLPISGNITLKDRNGVQLGPLATDSDGNYAFDVTGLASPFLLKAEWSIGSQSYTLFSVATGAGNVHINPFANLALMLAAGSDPALIFGAPGAKPDMGQITDAAIALALAKIKTLLGPLLIYYGIFDFDPLSGAYTATPDNKLDALLDVLSVKVENGTLTITNKLNGSVISSGSAANIPGIALDMTKTPEKEVLTDIKDLTERVGALCTIMNLGSALTVDKLEGLFIPDPDYGKSAGHTRAQDIQSIVNIFAPGGANKDGKLKTIRNVRLVSDQTANYSGRGVSKVYLLNYDFIHENGTVVHGNNTTFGKELSGGQWKFIDRKSVV